MFRLPSVLIWKVLLVCEVPQQSYIPLTWLRSKLWQGTERFLVFFNFAKNKLMDFFSGSSPQEGRFGTAQLVPFILTSQQSAWKRTTWSKSHFEFYYSQFESHTWPTLPRDMEWSPELHTPVPHHITLVRLSSSFSVWRQSDSSNTCFSSASRSLSAWASASWDCRSASSANVAWSSSLVLELKGSNIITRT